MTPPEPRILVVEDERDIAEAIRVNLSAQGYSVEVIDHGTRALEVAQRGGFDLVILDVMLPGLDGFEFCRRLRESDTETPILFLSALGETANRITGLRAGGDDYLPKPFDLDELLLRVEALLRRSGRTHETAQLVLGPTTVDWRRGTTSGPNGEHRLSDKEIRLLRYLAARRGEIVLRNDILDVVWGRDQNPSARTVDNFIVRLRKLLGDDSAHPRFLHTHRGAGYRLEFDDAVNTADREVPGEPRS